MFSQPLKVIIRKRPLHSQVLCAVAAFWAGVSAMTAQGSGALGQLGTGWGLQRRWPGSPRTACAGDGESEPWKQKGRSLCSRDRLSLREAAGGRLLEMPSPPTALQLPKAGCPSPPSLPGCFPSCSAGLSPAAGSRRALPPSPQLPFPGRPGEREARRHPTRILRSASSPSLCHRRFLSHTSCLLCVCQPHPRGVTVGGRVGWRR